MNKTLLTKKLLPILLVAVFAVSAVAIPAAVRIRASASILLGDVDKDGSVTAGDARLALRAAVDLEHYEKGSYEFTAADYDRDGTITAADARMILRTAVELEGLKYIEEETTKPETPTEKPTEKPTEAPTEKPTEPPTEKPTEAPTEKPTEAPTEPEIPTDESGDPAIDTHPTMPTPDEDEFDPNEEEGGLFDSTKIGKYFYNGRRVHYEDIPEGEWYTYYNENGWAERHQKPYSPGNEPTTVDPTVCKYCGKAKQPYDGEHYACYYGGCTRWIIDVECPECGDFVPANTCHTCQLYP